MYIVIWIIFLDVMYYLGSCDDHMTDHMTGSHVYIPWRQAIVFMSEEERLLETSLCWMANQKVNGSFSVRTLLFSLYCFVDPAPA